MSCEGLEKGQFDFNGIILICNMMLPIALRHNSHIYEVKIKGLVNLCENTKY